jgi:hypothetical protein
MAPIRTQSHALPEKDDMSCPIGPQQTTPNELPLRCVSSDMHDACSCHSRIPRAVVERAWCRELEAGGDDEGRFFHLIHDGGVWQAYGMGDGQVRGVYCPAHNSRRAALARAAVCEAGDVVYELALAA